MDGNTLFIASQTRNPEFNLAAEELLLRNFKQNVLFLYINDPSIIVGKHQNTLSEINLDYLEKNNIPVYRRLSGGGTVYHDPGNINFCIIENGKPGYLVDFVRATMPIVGALKAYGIEARHGKRNDLLAGYKKISGNACHVYKSRAMHHGTLLFNANINHLTEGLKADATKFKDKSVKSVRSEVINISELSEKEDSPEEFMKFIGAYLMSEIGAETYHFSEEDINEINRLVQEKYSSWEWNYGYSPVYEFSKRSKTENYAFSSKIKVEKGRITEIEIKSNHPDKESLRKAKESIKNCPHQKREIKSALHHTNEGIKEGILNCLF